MWKTFVVARTRAPAVRVAPRPMIRSRMRGRQVLFLRQSSLAPSSFASSCSCWYSSYSPNHTTTNEGTRKPQQRDTAAYRNNNMDGTVVRVGNLPPSTGWPELKDHFNLAGRVRSANVYNSNNNAEDDERYGLVVFNNASDARHAVEQLDGSTLSTAAAADHHHNATTTLAVRPATPDDLRDRGPPVDRARNDDWNESCSLYVSPLPARCRWQDLKDHMRCNATGTDGLPVRSANVYHDARGQPYGVVLYCQPRDAARARQALDASVLGGTPIRLYTAREYLQATEQQAHDDSVDDEEENDDDDFSHFTSDVDWDAATHAVIQGEDDAFTTATPQTATTTTTTTTTVYLTNLPPAVRWQNLKDFARQVGGVRSANVYATDTGLPYGEVVYYHADDAETAAKILGRIVWMGRKVHVTSELASAMRHLNS